MKFFLLLSLSLLISTVCFSYGQSDFAQRYLKELRSQNTDSKNLVTSPYSVELAFGQLDLGARGKTKKELETVFAKRSVSDWKLFSQGTKERGVKLYLGNNFWYQKQMKLEDQFLKSVQEAFGVVPEAVDFKDTENVRKKINLWVSQQTEKMIPEALKPGNLNSQVKLVLANTIYFKGQWKTQFVKDESMPRVFKNAFGVEKKLMMMTSVRPTEYFENADFQVVSLPFQDPNYEMVFFRPKSKSAKISEREFGQSLDLLSQARIENKVELHIPRFEVRFRTDDLKKTLQNLGLKTLFRADESDLSGLSKSPLFVNQVIHEAIVKIDESGAEAAAVTAVSARAGGVAQEIKSFILDRSFLFAIMQRQTKQILFFGEVNKI